MKGMKEIERMAWQNFSKFGLRLPLARELAKMIPEPTGYAFQSPCLLDQTT